MRSSSSIPALCVALLCASSSALAAVPSTMNFQAYLTSPSGEAVDEEIEARFRILDAPDGAAVWSETQTIDVDGGFLSASIGSATPLDPTVFDVDGALYLEVTIDGDVLGPPSQIDAVPYAMWAANALSEGEIRDVLSMETVPPDCADGQTVAWNDIDAEWTCAAPAADGEDGEDGDSVTVAVDTSGTCAHGGIVVTSATGDRYVCNGEPGVDGAAVSATAARVEDCPNGGISVTSETGTVHACNGAAGEDGEDVTVQTAAPGSEACAAGGVAIIAGGNTRYVCNGTDGGGAYGDASSGDYTIDSNEDWSTSPPEVMLFEDFVVSSEDELIVPSGTVIRTRGSFTNNGRITVAPGLPGERWFGNPDGFPASRGNAMTPPMSTGGRALPPALLRQILAPGPFGGSNGLSGSGSPDNDGGTGGGSLVIRVGGDFVNNGTITAVGGDGQDGLSDGDDGDEGGGGGGGGFVIVAAAGSITNSGTIDVRGGSGADGESNECGGGGGGGGVIHFLTGDADGVSGTLRLGGGAPGSGTCEYSGSGGGGAMGGDGGAAGGRDFVPPEAGRSGLVIRTNVDDPAPLF